MTTALLSQVGGDEAASRTTLLAAMPLSPEDVGARIARAREEKRPKAWSQFDLALALGVSPSTIYRWEKGKLPSMNELLRLTDVLDKPLSYLAEPPEHQIEIAELSLAIAELRGGAERYREASLEILASIDARLSRIEALLELQDDQGSDARP